MLNLLVILGKENVFFQDPMQVFLLFLKKNSVVYNICKLTHHCQ